MTMATAGVSAVGLVLFFSAIAKAVAPRAFARHLQRLVTMPDRLAAGLAVVVVAGEAAWALPLIVAAGPTVLVAATLALLGSFSGVTLLAWHSGRIAECGCYGPLLRLSPPVSAAVNLVLMMLLAAALAVEPPTAAATGGNIWAWATCAGLGTAALAVLLMVLPDLITPLAVGRPWPARRVAWPSVLPATESCVVAFLKSDCRLCRGWSKALHRLSAMPDFPAVTVVVARQSEVPAMQAGFPSFSVVACGTLVLWTLASSVPTAVVVRNRVIAEVWRDKLPAERVQWLKEARG
ncbi:MAG: hypothetical protein NTY19_24715 [Planctomycetota bacterium]|nr:hypothetical protein [Planctomycetota bacterium]